MVGWPADSFCPGDGRSLNEHRFNCVLHESTHAPVAPTALFPGARPLSSHCAQCRFVVGRLDLGQSSGSSIPAAANVSNKRVEVSEMIWADDDMDVILLLLWNVTAPTRMESGNAQDVTISGAPTARCCRSSVWILSSLAGICHVMCTDVD